MLSPKTRMDLSAAATAKEIGSTMRSNSVLAARGIGKTVKSGDSDLVILRDIELEITSGEAVGVGGASGWGKSTLLAILAGLDTPTTGTAQTEAGDRGAADDDARAERPRRGAALDADRAPGGGKDYLVRKRAMVRGEVGWPAPRNQL